MCNDEHPVEFFSFIDLINLTHSRQIDKLISPALIIFKLSLFRKKQFVKK